MIYCWIKQSHQAVRNSEDRTNGVTEYGWLLKFIRLILGEKRDHTVCTFILYSHHSLSAIIMPFINCCPQDNSSMEGNRDPHEKTKQNELCTIFVFLKKIIKKNKIKMCHDFCAGTCFLFCSVPVYYFLCLVTCLISLFPGVYSLCVFPTDFVMLLFPFPDPWNTCGTCLWCLASDTLLLHYHKTSRRTSSISEMERLVCMGSYILKTDQILYPVPMSNFLPSSSALRCLTWLPWKSRNSEGRVILGIFPKCTLVGSEALSFAWVAAISSGG